MSAPGHPFAAAFEWAAAGVFVLCVGLVVLAAVVVVAVLVVAFFVWNFFAAVVWSIREVAEWFARFCAGSGR